MIKRPDSIWAGTEASLSDYVDALSNIEAFTPPQGADEDDIPYLADVQGDIGVVKIHGPLTNRDAWYNRYAGITSYNDIREAMLYVAHNPDVKQILLDNFPLELMREAMRASGAPTKRAAVEPGLRPGPHRPSISLLPAKAFWFYS